MVVLDTSWKYVRSLLERKISLKEFEEHLLTLGFELDDAQNDEIKVDINPDRIDALSADGLARVLNSYLTGKTKKYAAKKSTYDMIIDSSVKKVRPYTACAVVKNLKFTDEKIKEIIWIQEKLHATFGKNRKKAAIGIYPMEHISWPITFCAKDPKKIKFKPLEAAKEMTGLQILSQHETGRTYAHLVEDLDKFAFFIDAKNEVLSMTPIINSELTGRITEKTKDVFIECSGHEFKPLSILLNMIVCVLADMGGTVYEVNIKGTQKKKTPELQYKTRTISKKIIQSMLGLQLSDTKTKQLLTKMQYQVTKITNSSITLLVPPYRTDIWHDVDIVDDIARAYGFNNFPIVPPAVATEGNTLFENRIQAVITNLLVGLGFHEIKTLGVTDKKDQFTRMNVPEQPHITLGSTAERSINMLRIWILPELLKFLSSNQQAAHPYNIFEIGDIVVPDKTADVRAKNLTNLSCVSCYDGVTFTTLKQTIEAVLNPLGLQAEYTVLENPTFIKGRAANITINKKTIGYMGEMHPEVLLNWGIEFPAVAFELNLSEIQW